MKHLLFASMLIISNSLYCMDNPHPDTQPDANDELHTSLSSSSADEQDHEQEQDYPDNIHIPVCFATSVPEKAQRKEAKQNTNRQLLGLAWHMHLNKISLNSVLEVEHLRGFTLLTAAAEHACHKNILEFALGKGANPNGADGRGNTPLRVAVAAYCTQNISFLLAHGAQPDNTLVRIICNPIDEIIKPKRISTLQLILDAGVDPNQAVLGALGNRAYTPSIMSLLLCHFDGLIKISGDTYDAFLAHRKLMITHLLDAGLNLFKEDANGKTDWQKIQECNDTYKEYDSQLFDFLQGHVSNKSRHYRFELQA